MKEVRIGVIGFGTVGSGVVKGLRLNRRAIRERTGLDITVKTIADLDLERDRGVDTAGITLTRDYRDIAGDEEVSIVVQVVGGTETAFDIMKELLERGKNVVTANKALLAERGPELFETARRNGVTIAFEASTAGGIPILSTLRTGLAGNTIQSVYGIVNGTSNYILSSMTHRDLAYEEALREAQENGYAEEDPTLDVEGIDAAHKLILLAALGFRRIVSMEDIHIEGITAVKSKDIAFARELGYTVKSLAVAARRENGLELRVHPTLLPRDHPLSAVSDAYNAVCVRGNLVGETMFYGKGAGSEPTASAVIADVIETASGVYGKTFETLCYFTGEEEIRVIPFSETVSKFYMRLTVEDKPGVLARITGVLTRTGISIASIIQKETAGTHAEIELMTHECRERDFQEARAEIERLEVVKEKASFIRAFDLRCC